MSQSAVTGIMVGSAVIACALLVRQLAAQIRRRRWNSSASFILLIACVVNLRPALGGFLHAFTVHTDVFYERTLIYAPSLNRLVKYGDRLLIAVAVVLVIRGLGRRFPLPRAALAALLLLALGCLASATHGDGLAGNAQILLALLFLASAFMQPGVGACLGAATFGIVMAVASGMLSVVNYTAAVQVCNTKCGPLGVLYPGAAESENGLGLILALATPFVYLAFEGKLRIWLTGYIVFMTVMTGSRTSQIAVAATVALLVLVRPSLEKTDDSPKRRRNAGWVVGVLCVVGLAAPFWVTDPGSLTQRGYVWSVARGAWNAAPWFGNGSKAWSKLADTGIISPAAVYSAHNEWLDALFLAGICGAIVFAAFLLFLLRSPEAGKRTALYVIVVPVLVAGVTERPWSFSGIDWLSWSLLAAILAVPPRGVIEHRGSQGAEHQPTLLPLPELVAAG
jgi:O-Antigen ligase